jgi:hypothetical protein
MNKYEYNINMNEYIVQIVVYTTSSPTGFKVVRNTLIERLNR